MTPRKRLENTINGFGGNDAFTGKGGGHLLDGVAGLTALSYVLTAKVEGWRASQSCKTHFENCPLR
jgi:hypothetical protein